MFIVESGTHLGTINYRSISYLPIYHSFQFLFKPPHSSGWRLLFFCFMQPVAAWGRKGCATPCPNGVKGGEHAVPRRSGIIALWQLLSQHVFPHLLHHDSVFYLFVGVWLASLIRDTWLPDQKSSWLNNHSLLVA